MMCWVDVCAVFYGAALFNGDVSKWDVSAVTIMRESELKDLCLAFLGGCHCEGFVWLRWKRAVSMLKERRSLRSYELGRESRVVAAFNLVWGLRGLVCWVSDTAFVEIHSSCVACDGWL